MPRPPPESEKSTTERQRFPARLFVARKSFWPSVAALAALLVASVPWMPVSLYAVWMGTLAAGALARVIARRERVVDGALEVVEGALTFDGQRLCERREIEAALLVPRRGRRPMVVLRRREGRPLRFEVDGPPEGRALIRALGLDPRQTVAGFSLPGMNQRARAAVFAGASALGLSALVSIPLLASLLPAVGVVLAIALYMTFLRLTRTTLQIGGDGLKIRYLGEERFIGHDEIDRVARCHVPHTGVELTLRSGELVRVPTATHTGGDGGLASGIAELLEGARSRGREDVAREASLLARRGRGATDWLRGIRSLAAGANADHRTAPLDPERVWRILEDPSAEASARVGAAALLATAAGEQERTRLRVAAKAIAAPRVRVAIDALVSGEDDAAVLEALGAVEGAETQERRKETARHATDPQR